MGECGRVNLSAGEIIVIVFVLVVVFSASRMGQLGNAIGKFVYSFKKASKGEDFVDAGRASHKLDRRRGTRTIEDGQIVDGEKRDS